MASPKIFTGKDGSFVFGGDTQLHVRNWTVEGNLALLDVTVLDDDTVSNEAGLKSFGGSCTVMYHEDDTTLANMLDNIFLSGEPLKAKASFRWSNKKIEFNCFITSASIAVNAGEIITTDVSFTSSGDITAVTL